MKYVSTVGEQEFTIDINDENTSSSMAKNLRLIFKVWPGRRSSL